VLILSDAFATGTKVAAFINAAIICISYAPCVHPLSIYIYTPFSVSIIVLHSVYNNYEGVQCRSWHILNYEQLPIVTAQQ